MLVTIIYLSVNKNYFKGFPFVYTKLEYITFDTKLFLLMLILIKFIFNSLFYSSGCLISQVLTSYHEPTIKNKNKQYINLIDS